MDSEPNNSQETLLVVPCFKERLRLPRFLPELCRTLEDSNTSVRILVVDDGSPPEEAAFLQRYVEALRPRFSRLDEPLLLDENQGKGGAIRAGWNTGDSFDRLAFVDADGAVSASEVGRVLASDPADRVLLAIRDPKNAHSLERTLSRKAAAKLFNWLIRCRYDIDVPDTQCGFKIVPGEFYRNARSELKQCSYAFDLELILAARKAGYEMDTIPVDWTEIPGSSTNAKEALAFLKQLLQRSI